MGVVLALLGALAFSFMNVFIRNGVRPDDRDDGVLTTMLVNAAMLSSLLAWVVLTAGIGQFSAEAFVWFVVAGLSSTFLGRQTLFGGIRLIGAARAAAIKNATPLVTLIIALTFLGERLTLLAGGGIAMIMVGLFALIAESVQGSRDPSGDDPVETGVQAGTLAEAGLWEWTRDLADRTMATIAEPSRRRVLLGVGLGILAALFFGSGHAFRKVGMDLLPDALLGATIGTWTATISYLLVAAVRRRTVAVLRSAITLARPYVWAAGIAGTVGQLSFFAALAFAPVSYVSVVAGSETVITVVLAALLAGRIEAITHRVVLPAGLVFAGTALIALAG